MTTGTALAGEKLLGYQTSPRLMLRWPNVGKRKKALDKARGTLRHAMGETNKFCLVPRESSLELQQ